MGTVREIPVEEARPLRHEILRSHQPFEKCFYSGDNDDTTLHLGAFHEGELVGIISIINEPPPGEDDDNAWRIRGMAVKDSVRRKGYGSALMERAEQHARAHGGSCIWFNARTSAVPFYRSAGFTPEGDEYDLGELGPHYFMRKPLRDPAETTS